MISMLPNKLLKQKINILYLHNNSQISGGERSLLNLWENMDRSCFNVFLIIPSVGDLSKAAQMLNVTISYLEIPQLHFKNILDIFHKAKKLFDFLRSNNIHIIHSYSPRNNILSVLVARILGISVIWHERNMIYESEKDISNQFFFLPKFIICNSNAVAQRFNRQLDVHKKVRVILNGVNLENFQTSLDSHDLKEQFGLKGVKIVGMITNLNKRKRVEFLLDTIPLVCKNIQNVKFLIVGGEFPDEGGVRLKELQEYVKNLGIEQYVVFTDFQDDVRPFLNILDLFVHTTLKEACSRAILEAMAYRKAVIAMNDGGNPELISHDHTGILIDPYSKEELAMKITELLRDDSKRAMFGDNARQRLEKYFDVKKNAQETQKIYLECQA